jgi:hypothetical protein
MLCITVRTYKERVALSNTNKPESYALAEPPAQLRALEARSRLRSLTPRSAVHERNEFEHRCRLLLGGCATTTGYTRTRGFIVQHPKSGFYLRSVLKKLFK